MAVEGKVYNPAVARVDTPSVDFGIVHVGDTIATRAIGITNSASVEALNDTMRAVFGGVDSGFTGTGTASALAAGQSDAGSLRVGLDTSSAGVFTGFANIDFASQNPDMADLDIGRLAVNLSGQVNNHANASFEKLGGSGILTGSDLLFEFNFGNIVRGSNLDSTLALTNDVTGPSDLLRGSYVHVEGLDGVFDFDISGFDPFAGLDAGDRQGGLLVGFDALQLGLFSDEIRLIAFGSNASGFEERFDVLLRLSANVIDGGTVPEPNTLLLLMMGPLGMLLARRRHAKLRRV